MAGTSTSTYTPYQIPTNDSSSSDYVNNLHKAADQAAQAAKDAATLSADSYESQRPAMTQDYNDSNTAANSSFEKAVNPYGTNASKLVSQGLYGSPLSETGRISAGNTYQNQLGLNSRNYQNAMANLTSQINQAKLKGNIDAANILADYGKTMAQAAYQQQRDNISDQEYNNDQLYNKWVQDNAQQQFNQSLEYTKTNDQLNRDVQQNQFQQTYDYTKTNDQLNRDAQQNQFQQTYNYTKANDQANRDLQQQQLDYTKSNDATNRNVQQSQFQQDYNYTKLNDEANRLLQIQLAMNGE